MKFQMGLQLLLHTRNKKVPKLACWDGGCPELRGGKKKKSKRRDRDREKKKEKRESEKTPRGTAEKDERREWVVEGKRRRRASSSLVEINAWAHTRGCVVQGREAQEWERLLLLGSRTRTRHGADSSLTFHYLIYCSTPSIVIQYCTVQYTAIYCCTCLLSDRSGRLE